MPRSLCVRAALLALGFLGAHLGPFAASNVSSEHADAWAPNAGWLNWRPDDANGVEVGQYVCSGNIYAANFGWINLGSGRPANGVQYQNNSASDFGVNVDDSGRLRGYAYGANVGWIHFEETGNPRVNLMGGTLSGFAYGSNIGWISLGDATFTLMVNAIAPGTDSDGDGIPDAWELTYAGNLTTFSATSDFDQDGASDLQEYLAGTNPLDPTDLLEIVTLSLTASPSTAFVSWTSKPDRQYRLELRASLSSTNQWLDSGLGLIGPDGAVTSRTIPAGPPRQFLRIEAVRPLIQSP